MAAELAGINLGRARVLAFVVSAACAGVAGSLIALHDARRPAADLLARHVDGAETILTGTTPGGRRQVSDSCCWCSRASTGGSSS